MYDFVQKIKGSALFKNSVVYTVAEIINKAIPFLLLPVLTTYLSTADYGVVANYQMFGNVLMLIVGLSTHTAITVNFFKIDNAELKFYVTSVLFILLLSFVSMLVLLLLFGAYLESYLGLFFFWVVVAGVYSTTQFLNTVVVKLYILRQEPLRVAVFQIAKTLVDVGVTLFLIVSLGMKWEGRLIGLTSAAMLFSIISLVILVRMKLISRQVNFTYVKDALRIGVPLIPHQLSGWLKNGADRFFITAIVGINANGIYSLAFQLGLILLILFQSFNQAFAPYLFEKLTNITKKEKLSIVKLSYSIAGAFVVFVVLGVFLGPIVFKYFIGEAYYPALKLLPLIFIAFGFKGLYLLVVNYLIFEKETERLAKITFTISVLHAMLSYLSIKYIGLEGACYTLIFSEFLTFIIVLRASNKVSPMPWVYFLKK